MGFKENLRAELNYSGLPVKELASRSGVNIHTINNYLNVRSRMPSAESAVKIAKTLGVSVEYLITGNKDDFSAQNAQNAAYEIRVIAESAKKLNPKNRKIIIDLLDALKYA